MTLDAFERAHGLESEFAASMYATARGAYEEGVARVLIDGAGRQRDRTRTLRRLQEQQVPLWPFSLSRRNGADVWCGF